MPKTKRTVAGIMLPPISNDGGEAQVEVSDPGHVLDTLIQPVESSVIASMNPMLERQIDLRAVILFELDPDARKHKHNYIILPAGKVLESDNEIVYKGRFLYPDGRIFFLYEEMVPWVHPEDKLPGGYCSRCHRGIKFWAASDESPCNCTQDDYEDFQAEEAKKNKKKE